MTVHKKVSVALATYNGGNYLNEQIESILNQTYENIELVISDDNSCDNTRDIIQKYTNSDSRVTYVINNNDRGFVRNFENAINHCTGEYIALSDQDDIWELDKIEKLVENIMGYSLIHSDAYLISKNGQVVSESYTTASKKNIEDIDVIDVILNNPVTGCTAMFHRSLMSQALPFPEGIAVHDKWLALIAALNNGVVYYNKPLIKYRQHDNNLIGASMYARKSIMHRYKELKSKKEKIVFNEKYQYQLVKNIIDSKVNQLSQDEVKKLSLLLIYYIDIINSNFPIKAFFIRCYLFSEFEKRKSLKVRFVSLFSIFKKTLVAY